MYNTVLVSGLQESDSVVYFFQIISIIRYYNMLSIDPMLPGKL